MFPCSSGAWRNSEFSIVEEEELYPRRELDLDIAII
jgi:hypothetical protein